MTERHFDKSLVELKEKLIMMAGHVEKSIQNATEALLEWDIKKIDIVFIGLDFEVEAFAQYRVLIEQETRAKVTLIILE